MLHVYRSYKRLVVSFVFCLFLLTVAGQDTLHKKNGARPDITNDNGKISPGLKMGTGRSGTYIVTFRSSIPAFTSLLKEHPSVEIIRTDTLTHSVVIRCREKYLFEKIIPLKEVIYAGPYSIAQTEANIIGYDRSLHGINLLDYSVTGANGKNIVVGVKENAMDSRDLDLYKRVKPSSLAAQAIDYHATVISSIIGGSGNSFYDGRGLANGCYFFSSTYDNLFADNATVLQQAGVTVQNHSYGTIPQQFYGPEALSYDIQSWQNKNWLHVFSAGNRGTASATEGRYQNIANYANSTGNFKMAKNVLVIAAVDKEGRFIKESSAGPAYDGRLIPQLCALGPNGTSDAAAIVSGAAAVVQQVYADLHAGAIPPASLVKAALFTTATDTYRNGIDFRTGYGMVNSYAAVQAIRQKNYDTASLSQGLPWQKNIQVPANITELKLTLCWTDTAATLNNQKAIVNDLDLELEDISTAFIYKPWVLNTSPNIDSLQKEPVRGRDSLNTAEQISIRLPAAGLYRIRVKGTGSVMDHLPFSIAFKMDTLHTFSFTNPQHSSDVLREENDTLTVRWNTFLSDVNETGKLSITYNNGSNWQLLNAAASLGKNSYPWFIKDTSCAARFRMETSFGSFFSKDFILSKITRPNVDFLCTDSFALSWNKHIDAYAYRIYMLTDSPYLKPFLTVQDTSYVFNRSQYPSLVYAIEPLLNNGIPSVRSIATDITFQGVSCFYRSLNYTLLDGNWVNLSLELSSTRYTDSVVFEEVSAQGQLIRELGRQTVLPNDFVYEQLTTRLVKGVVYFRGKIKLKSGQSFYTDIISVVSSGNENVFLYPNPVKKGVMLNLVLKQGASPDDRLLFFDNTGRLINTLPATNGKINTTAFPAGIFFYQLIDIKGKRKENGKFIVH